MKHTFRVLIAALAVALPAKAFTLIGTFAAWQSATLGYQLGADAGGPMPIGQGYRWTVPIMTYSYDHTFLTSFGQQGVDAVEAAIAALNALPAADEMTAGLTEFPQQALRVNNTAAGLSLLDLKTTTLSIIMGQLGLGAPERYVWTLRGRYVPVQEPIAVYSTITRNYDPVTWDPTPYVNGNLFTYQILETYTTPTYEAVDFYSQPLPRSPRGLSLAGLWGIGGGTVDTALAALELGSGVFYEGLSRDDAGGLRYLYTTANAAVETLGADVVAGTATGGTSIGTGGLSGSPWIPSISISVLTNAAATNTGTVTVVSNALPKVVTALRPGVGKVKWVRVNYDSLLGSTTSPYVLAWTDRYYTNGSIKTQPVSRLITQPDYVFGAGDLGVADAIPVIISSANNYVDESAINTDAVGGGFEADGPGTILPRIGTSFSNVGRYYLNIGAAGAVGENNATVGFSYGSFDGTTNAPILYPNGFSIMELLALVAKGQ